MAEFRDIAKFYARATRIMYEELEEEGIAKKVSVAKSFELAEKMAVSILIENYRKESKGLALDMSELTEGLPRIEWVSRYEMEEQTDPRLQQVKETGAIELEDGARINPVAVLNKKITKGELTEEQTEQLREVIGIPSDLNVSIDMLCSELQTVNPELLLEWIQKVGII